MVIGTAIIFTSWALTPVATRAQASDEGEGAHETIRLKKGRFQFPSQDGWVDVSDVTAYCLECHGDGDTGSAGEETSAPKSSHELGGLGTSHPVNVVYPAGRPNYRPAGSLDERLVLVDGRVSCLTCHSPSPDRSLVISTKQGRLCVACHVM
jgi:hypothetical protein